MNTQLLTKLWTISPFSWALIRSNEIDLLCKTSFKQPILEVGCGDGLVTHYIFSGKKRSIDCGIDLDSEEIRRAQKSGMYQQVKVADITRAPFKANSFSTVFANGVLEHIPDLEQAISEISRLLKPNGLLITTSPTDNYGKLLFYYRLAQILGFSKVARRYEHFVNSLFAHRHLLTPTQWKQLLKRHKLKVLRMQFYNDSYETALHDLGLPFGLGTKIIKKHTDRLVLFPILRALFIPFLVNQLFRKNNQPTTATYHRTASILIVANKI